MTQNQADHDNGYRTGQIEAERGVLKRANPFWTPDFRDGWDRGWDAFHAPTSTPEGGSGEPELSLQCPECLGIFSTMWERKEHGHNNPPAPVSDEGDKPCPCGTEHFPHSVYDCTGPGCPCHYPSEEEGAPSDGTTLKLVDISIEYAPDAGSMYLTFSKGKIHHSEELSHDLIADVTEEGQLVGLDLQGVSGWGTFNTESTPQPSGLTRLPDEAFVAAREAYRVEHADDLTVIYDSLNPRVYTDAQLAHNQAEHDKVVAEKDAEIARLDRELEGGRKLFNGVETARANESMVAQTDLQAANEANERLVAEINRAVEECTLDEIRGRLRSIARAALAPQTEDTEAETDGKQ